MGRFLQRLLCAAIASALPAAVTAAEPVFTHIHPAGVQAGPTTIVALNGKFDPWPCQVHADAPGLTFTPRKDAGTFDLTVGAAVPPGPHLLRAFNAEGASAPVAIVITREPQTLETEPNDDFHAPQKLENASGCFDITVNGRMDKGDDVDCFSVTLTKGQTLAAWSEAYVLAAGFDAMLRITDAAGNVLAFNHDGPSCMDPLLIFTAPADGTYIVQTMGHKYPAATDIQFQGGLDCLYRLHLSTAPLGRHTWPLAISSQSDGAVAVEGWNLKGMVWNPDAPPPFVFPPPRSKVPEVTESAAPQTLAIPSAVSGRLSADGETDRYLFSAAKGEILDLAVTGPDLGSEIDAWLKILDSQGAELATNDDSADSSDARLRWTAPADGVFTAAVGDLTHRSGTDFYYRLSITRPEPGTKATVAAHAFKIEAGGSREIPVTVTLENGFSTPLILTARELPDGITAPEVPVPDKGGAVTLTLTASKEAATTSKPFRLVLAEKDKPIAHPVEYVMVSTTENNGVPQGYRKLLVPATTELWLTVTPAPPQPPPPAVPASPVKP